MVLVLICIVRHHRHRLHLCQGVRVCHRRLGPQPPPSNVSPARCWLGPWIHSCRRRFSAVRRTCTASRRPASSARGSSYIYATTYLLMAQPILCDANVLSECLHLGVCWVIW
ncbi:hypothetical protein FOA52_011891 [Chlamydomonas sp. UWO 241]|nr:hypothetical protein FOA52_011891 [Chlamydomonas sp. UWO 241]